MKATASEALWRNQNTRPLLRELVAPSSYDRFWPEGWLVWACIVLGTFDVSMVGFLVSRWW